MRAASSVTGPGAPSVWLKDRLFDLSFIFGIAVLATLMSGATVLWPILFLPMLTAHTWLFGYDHLIATYTKLAGSPEDRARHRQLILFLPPVVFGALLAVSRLSGLTGLYVLYFFGQFPLNFSYGFHKFRFATVLARSEERRVGKESSPV